MRCVHVHLVRQIGAQGEFEGELWPAHTAGSCRLSQGKGDQLLWCSSMLLPVTGHGYSSGSSLLSQHFDQEDLEDFACWFGILGYLTAHAQVQSIRRSRALGELCNYVKWSWHHHGRIRLPAPHVILYMDIYFSLRCPVTKWIFLGL